MTREPDKVSLLRNTWSDSAETRARADPGTESAREARPPRRHAAAAVGLQSA